MLRWAGASICLSFVSCVAIAGCVDPRSDYEDYLSRTADARAAAEETDAGTVDSAAPDAAFQQTYLMACLPGLFGGNVTDAVLFSASLTYKPTSGGGGQLTVSETSLVAGASNLTQTVGDSVASQPTAVAANGTATASLPSPGLPAAANPTGMGAIDFDGEPQLSLVFVPTATDVQVCAGLSANITSPVKATLTKNDTPCIFLPMKPQDTFPPLTESQFHCP
jgi:hypothetical protein